MKTINEVAAIFNVHPRTIRRWIADGKIDTLKLNGIIRIEESEIERTIEEGRKK